jgi:hypothetical protein
MNAWSERILMVLALFAVAVLFQDLALAHGPEADPKPAYKQRFTVPSQIGVLRSYR